MPNKNTAPDIDALRAFISAVEWRFAKTMAWCPHFYNVLEWNPEKRDGFLKLVRAIFDHGYQQEWPTPEERKAFGDRKIPKRIVTYFDVDEYKYWVMSEKIDDVTLINRAEICGLSKHY